MSAATTRLDLVGELTAVRSNRDALLNRLAEVEAERDGDRAEIDAVKSELAGVIETCTRTETERDAAGSKLAAAEAERDEARAELAKALARCARLEPELAEAKKPPKRERLTTKALQRMSEAELKAIDVDSLDREEQRLLLAFYKYLGDICGGVR